MKPSALFFSAMLLTTILPELTKGAFCTYYRSSNSVTCGSVTCSTATLSWNDKLPAGDYYIGDFYYHGGSTPWFNLFRRRTGTNDYWDYHTQVPELGCRGGFGLHAGTISQGCVTVTDYSCFHRLRAQIQANYPVIYFSVKECRSCFWRWCTRGISTVRRPCTADLQSV